MSEENRLEFFRLAKRFNQLGTMLPKLDDIDDDDLDKVAEARLIIEMHKTRAAMDKVLDAEWKLRGEKRPVVRW